MFNVVFHHEVIILNEIYEKPEDGVYEPLIRYIILEQSQAAVDVPGHRPSKCKKTDLK